MAFGFTASNQSQQRLHEYPNLLGGIVASAMDAIIATDETLRIVVFNAAAQKMFACPQDEAIGNSIEHFIPHLRAEHLASQMNASATLRGLRPTGEEFPIEASICKIELDGKEFFSLVLRDITERRLAERAVRESEEKFLKAFRGSPVALTLSRLRDRSFIEVNDTFERLTGYRREEVIGRTALEIGLWVDPSQREALTERLLHERSLRDLELHFRTKNGDLLTCLVSAELIEVGGELCILNVGSDITERKCAEETLRESEEKFRSVFREAGVGMVIVSPEGRFLATNGTFCDCLGYTEEELLARTVESVTFPEDWPAFSQKLREALIGVRGFQWFEKRCLHKSGRIVYTESSASLIRNRNGEPQYFVGEVLDVTKRKEAEESLSDMSRKLIEAQEQERARIARELHDDITQRLAMLAVELDQLRENPSEIHERVQDLGTEVTEILNNVQALSHDLHSSQLEYLGVVTAMKSWCREFGERQGMQIDYRHNVRSTVPPEVGLCLFRVLQEALHNVAKHSGVKRIEVELNEDAGEIHLNIKDLGKGFDLKAAMQSKGLGLTSMRERVRLVNGTIAIDAKPMCGTTIRVGVPLESKQDSHPQAV